MLDIVRTLLEGTSKATGIGLARRARRVTSCGPAARPQVTLARDRDRAAADQWIGDEQWLAGFPANNNDRCGWLWWRGS